MIWLWLVVFLFVVLVWICLSHLHMQLFFSRVKDNDYVFAQFKALGGLFRYRVDIPFVEYRGVCGGFFIKMKTIASVPQDQTQHSQKEQFTPGRVSGIYHLGKRLMAHVREFTEWLRHMLTHVKCDELRWDTRIGIGDAAETALAVGMLWVVKSTVLGYIFQYVHLEAKPRLSIQPQYHHPEFSMEFSGHVRIRIGFLLFSMLQLAWRIMKSKNGLKTWKTLMLRRNRMQKA